MMGSCEDLNRKQPTRATFAFSFSSFGLLLIMSAVSAARPQRVQLPIIEETPNNITVVVGDRVILPCTVIGLGTKHVVWKKYQTPIFIGEMLYNMDPSYKLFQHPVPYLNGVMTHTGKGSAYGAENKEYGMFDSNHDSYYPYGESDFGANNNDPYGYGSRGNSYHRENSGDAYKHFGSNRNNHRYPDDSNGENPYWNLLIENVEKRHAGPYVCEISTNEDIFRNVTLNVIVDPLRGKTGIKLTGTNFVEKGNSIDLNCTATAIEYRPKGVDWFKDGSKMKAGDGVVITEWVMSETNVLHSRLEVERATMKDAGTYVCRFSEHHVESMKVIVLNTESQKHPRETESDGLRGSKASDNSKNSSSGLTAGPVHVLFSMFLSLLLLVRT